jgi:hypothetical protein
MARNETLTDLPAATSRRKSIKADYGGDFTPQHSCRTSKPAQLYLAPTLRATRNFPPKTCLRAEIDASRSVIRSKIGGASTPV